MHRTAEAVIVGGGIIGNSIAYFLAKEGIKPVVVEKRDIAGGASGACDKAIILSSKNPGIHLELALKSADLYRELAEELGEEVEYRQEGGMIVIESPAEWETMERFVARQRRSGLNIRLLDKKETKELQPVLSDHILGATYNPDDAEVNPIMMTLALAKRAKQLGAEYLLHTEVIGVEVAHGKVKAVETSRGKIATNLVINAAGAWAPLIGDMAGLKIPIKPRRGQLLITEAMPKMIRGDILSAKYIAAKYNPDLVAQGEDLFSRLGVGLSLGQTESGNFIIGATREFVGYDTGNTPEGIEAVARNAVRIVPVLERINLIRTFAGLRPYTPDGIPILDWAPEVEGMFIAAGHEGDGIALAPITGKLVLQLITGQKPAVNPEPFKTTRF